GGDEEIARQRKIGDLWHPEGTQFLPIARIDSSQTHADALCLFLVERTECRKEVGSNVVKQHLQLEGLRQHKCEPRAFSLCLVNGPAAHDSNRGREAALAERLDGLQPRRKGGK